MTYEELVEKTREVYGTADASSIEGHIAYQFNIEGEAAGAFYLEICDGTVKVEPYEYYDRDALFTTTAETLFKIGTGKLDPVFAYTTGKLKVEGDLDKALLLKKISVNVEDKKPVEKKEDKTAVKTEEKAEEKAAETQAEAKTEAKPVEKEETKTAETKTSETSTAQDEAKKWPNRSKKKRR